MLRRRLVSLAVILSALLFFALLQAMNLPG